MVDLNKIEDNIDFLMERQTKQEMNIWLKKNREFMKKQKEGIFTREDANVWFSKLGFEMQQGLRTQFKEAKRGTGDVLFLNWIMEEKKYLKK